MRGDGALSSRKLADDPGAQNGETHRRSPDKEGKDTVEKNETRSVMRATRTCEETDASKKTHLAQAQIVCQVVHEKVCATDWKAPSTTSGARPTAVIHTLDMAQSNLQALLQEGPKGFSGELKCGSCTSKFGVVEAVETMSTVVATFANKTTKAKLFAAIREFGQMFSAHKLADEHECLSMVMATTSERAVVESRRRCVSIALVSTRGDSTTYRVLWWGCPDVVEPEDEEIPFYTEDWQNVGESSHGDTPHKRRVCARREETSADDISVDEVAEDGWLLTRDVRSVCKFVTSKLGADLGLWDDSELVPDTLLLRLSLHDDQETFELSSIPSASGGDGGGQAATVEQTLARLLVSCTGAKRAVAAEKASEMRKTVSDFRESKASSGGQSSSAAKSRQGTCLVVREILRYDGVGDKPTRSVFAASTVVWHCGGEGRWVLQQAGYEWATMNGTLMEQGPRKTVWSLTPTNLHATDRGEDNVCSRGYERLLADVSADACRRLRLQLKETMATVKANTYAEMLVYKEEKEKLLGERDEQHRKAMEASKERANRERNAAREKEALLSARSKELAGVQGKAERLEQEARQARQEALREGQAWQQRAAEWQTERARLTRALEKARKEAEESVRLAVEGAVLAADLAAEEERGERLGEAVRTGQEELEMALCAVQRQNQDLEASRRLVEDREEERAEHGCGGGEEEEEGSEGSALPSPSRLESRCRVGSWASLSGASSRSCSSSSASVGAAHDEEGVESEGAPLTRCQGTQTGLHCEHLATRAECRRTASRHVEAVTAAGERARQGLARTDATAAVGERLSECVEKLMAEVLPVVEGKFTVEPESFLPLASKALCREGDDLETAPAREGVEGVERAERVDEVAASASAGGEAEKRADEEAGEEDQGEEAGVEDQGGEEEEARPRLPSPSAEAVATAAMEQQQALTDMQQTAQAFFATLERVCRAGDGTRRLLTALLTAQLGAADAPHPSPHPSHLCAAPTPQPCYGPSTYVGYPRRTGPPHYRGGRGRPSAYHVPHHHAPHHHTPHHPHHTYHAHPAQQSDGFYAPVQPNFGASGHGQGDRANPFGGGSFTPRTEF